MEYTLGGETYLATRFKLRGWLSLESAREQFVEAIETEDIYKLSDSICTYVSIASTKPKNEVELLPWYEVVDAFLKIESENKVTVPVALFRTKLNKKVVNDVPWEYEGRNWYWWANLIARAYGWTLDCIANLEIDDALGLMQEIMVDEQLQKEWQWSLTEIAYPYNETTKTSRFKPLDRPDWMNLQPTDLYEEPKKYRMRRDMLPAGIIIRTNGETIIN